jgi:hypothetical protein
VGDLRRDKKTRDERAAAEIFLALVINYDEVIDYSEYID